MLPLFLNVTGRRVVVVGGGNVAAAKLPQLLTAGASVRIVAPEICADIRSRDVQVAERPFRASDLDDAWLVVAAATPAVNHQVAVAAGARRLFVNAVDDPSNATAYLSGVVRRENVTIAISTEGDAPALTSLLREALNAALPQDLARWLDTARRERRVWRRDNVPMADRKPRLLAALNRLYDAEPGTAGAAGEATAPSAAPVASVPWLSAPEDSWL